jgi:hypothetical protein
VGGGWAIGKEITQALVALTGGGGSVFCPQPIVPVGDVPQRWGQQENYPVCCSWARNLPTTFVEELEFKDDHLTVFAVLKAVAEGGLVSDLWASGEVVIHPSIAAKFAEEVRQDRLLIYEQVVESASCLPR